MQEQLILKNHNLVYQVLKKMNLYEKLDEFYDIAIIGLVKAAKTYDDNKKIKFSTYACTCIRNELFLYLRQQKSNKFKANYNTISLEKIITDDDCNGILLKDILASKVNIEKELIYHEEIRKLYKAISNLNHDEKFILEYTYGLNNKMILSQKELAKLTDMSQANVSRIIKKSLKKLREALRE